MALEFLRDTRPTQHLELHPGINFSNMPVGGDLGGLIFAAGSVIAVVIGLHLWWFLAGTVAGGFVLGAALIAWRGRH